MVLHISDAIIVFIDGRYPDGQDIFWTIDAENGVSNIALTLRDLDIEQRHYSDPYHCFDSLMIVDMCK